MRSLAGLPGAEFVMTGLSDLEAGVPSVSAFLVSLGAPRLMQLGIDIPRVEPDPEHRLYLLLQAEHAAAAHGRYNALVRRLVSFERALECAG